jgi:hypothetical protein
LDIYHAKARIIKEMGKYHPDFRAAKQDLTIILQPFSNMAIFQYQMKILKSNIANIP